jgi:hypothetical protein
MTLFEDRNITDDIELGAMLLCALSPTCASCGTRETPQWRRGWYSHAFGKIMDLCNACGIKYQKSQYCGICRKVYNALQVRYEHRHLWTCCNSCGGAIHISCSQSDNPCCYRCAERSNKFFK